MPEPGAAKPNFVLILLLDSIMFALHFNSQVLSGCLTITIHPIYRLKKEPGKFRLLMT